MRQIIIKNVNDLRMKIINRDDLLIVRFDAQLYLVTVLFLKKTTPKRK